MSRGVPFPALLRSEWTKLRSVRSTWWSSAVYVVVVGAFSWLAAAVTDRAPAAGVAVSTALTGFGFGQVVLVVLGVLVGAGEHTTGMALASYAAVPRRTRLQLARTVVVAALVAVLSVVLAVGCALAARLLTVVPGGVDLTDPSVLRPLGLQVLSAVALVVLGVAVGTALRSTAGGVGACLLLVLVLPVLLAADGGPWTERLGEALPALRVGEDAFLVGASTWPVGLVVVGAWALGAWAIGAVLIERRDV
ncbi:ABC transporter permease [Geodermatophilus sp. CPCC 205761]|uniref:ABC transporter permease n=1 Tax=Geodermatophilus sp. CPCC 205761 TaxID=2936597 RepID=UPI003EE9080F